MPTILLIAAAAAAFFWPQLRERVRTLQVPTLAPWQWVAVGLLLAAAVSLYRPTGAGPAPTPAPDAGPLALRGAFKGPTASEDAATIGALANELADEIEWDGMAEKPLFASGVALDELRRRARSLRCRGVSIGDRQPEARDKIAAHLEANVGTEGGPLTPEGRSAWVSALRDIGRAASDAAR
jgi:hypothetical protein